MGVWGGCVGDWVGDGVGWGVFPGKSNFLKENLKWPIYKGNPFIKIL